MPNEAPTLTTAERGPRQRYSLEDKERALAALVLAGGSYEGASRTLKDQGHDIDRQRIYDWRHEQTERYEELRVELSSTVAQRIASEAEALAVQYSEKEAAILASLDEHQIKKLAPKERADTLRSLATSKALQIDKVASPLRGRPSTIVQRKDPDQLLRQIETIVGHIDSTATEIHETQALEDGTGP